MSDQQPPDLKMGKYFVWLAWCSALGLLVFFFQDILDKQWNPNQSPEFTLSNTGKAEVVLEQNRQGHYVTRGTINGQTVVFLLDTGATNVSIPAHIAEQLSLTSYGSHIAQTANGNVRVFKTTLDELSIGNLFLNNIDASINPGMKTNEILLGMSALKKVEFTQSGKRLILRER
ncbi:retropepsin-like aspartic protease family protein [Thalassotalea marina]|uniref:Aspartyl protease n=1 Tax=Thalassotalea marina TaxID=1673741 RepID=A0A919BCH1_9GAMM|nr:TIGR02281 family clan AA aspartic protease [Thalassotalea marina]GHF79631.1 aspartyl protease [Thalassotalea marina]